MFKKILFGLVLIVTIILVVAALKPSHVTLSQEMTIKASPAAIFPYINNAKKSYEWMPWADGDPGIKIEFSGPEEGVGAMSQWNGKNMGAGKSEVIESVENRLVRTKLEYTKPFSMEQTAEILLNPTPDGTLVKWNVSGESPFMFRVIGLFMNCKKIAEEQFLKGLSKLKNMVEK
jgi:uncharacterized protein YndB with AHSA1/START domain